MISVSNSKVLSLLFSKFPHFNTSYITADKDLKSVLLTFKKQFKPMIK